MESAIEWFNTNGTISVSITVIALILTAIYSQKKKHKKAKINLNDLYEKIAAYNPEPLVPEEEFYVEPTVPTTTPECKFDTVQNLLRQDYIDLTNNAEIRNLATDIIRTNGVGSCGPRGFYGTVDVHLDLEYSIANFMGLEEAVLYSYSASTMSSAIIAYCKKGDVIFCDEKTCYPSIQGIKAAKATIVYFKHNDMKDLEEKLIQHDQKELNKKNKSRKFLLVEGIYSQTGTICPLPELMLLRKMYMARMFLDECISFGSIGKHGRGVTEYYNVDRDDIDLIVGSLEFGVGSIGGFCVGSSFVMEHQRLSGLGYCFSASLPPFLSRIASHAIEIFEKQPKLFEDLSNISKEIHNKLDRIDWITMISHPLSPKKVFKPVGRNLDEIIKLCMDKGVIVGSCEDTIYFNVNISMDQEYISKIIEIFETI